MTFEEALDRLPECSYATRSKELTGGGREVQVWFLYYHEGEQDSEEEDGPCVEMVSTRYNGDWPFGGGQNWMPAGEVPDEVRELNWKKSPVGYEDLPRRHRTEAILRVLEE